MAAKTGRSLVSADKVKPPADRVLLGTSGFEQLGPVFEVVGEPVTLTLYGANMGQSVGVYSVFGPYEALQIAEYRVDGDPVVLSDVRTSVTIEVSGRYRLVLYGSVGPTVVSVKNIVNGKAAIPQPSGVQANKPNLFLDGTTTSPVIEIVDKAWVFTAYGLQPSDYIDTYAVYGTGINYREERLFVDGNPVYISDLDNSVTLEKSGRYVFKLVGNPTNVTLVGNPTQLAAAETGGGEPGPPGQGVPPGGTVGQILAKLTDASFSTVWIDAPSGVGTVTSVAIVGTDGIQVDSGSPITSAGIIQLGLSAGTLSALAAASTALQPGQADAPGAAAAAQAAANAYTDAELANYTPTSSLGSAAFQPTSAFATAAQGVLATTALQPGSSISWAWLTGVPQPIQALASISSTGVYVVTAAGTSTTRQITGVAGRISVTDGTGVAGNPTIDLATLADAGGGTLQKTVRDAYGRVSGTSSATTSDLAEGANLYFSSERAQDAVGSALVSTPTVALTYDDALNQISAALTDEAYNAPLQLVYGQQYLTAFHNKLIAKTSAKMIFSGDSTTQGGGTGATGEFILSQGMLTQGMQRGHILTSVNAGHSGEDTADWVSTYLAADLAQLPDLYVLRWGLNDPLAGRTAADFRTSLRAGLTTLRASYSPSQMSVLLMVPSTVNDPPNGRTEAWVRSLRPIVREAARDFQCAFLDTYTLWPDAVNAAGVWMDNPFGDGRAIHPLNVMNSWIITAMARLVFPEFLDAQRYGTYVPTLTNVANVTSSAPSVCQWMRVGNVVTVSGRVDINPTAAAGTLTQLGVSLPVPSNFTNAAQLGGNSTLGQTTYTPMVCLADTANDRATFQFLSAGTGSVAAFFSFTYLVLP